MQTSSLQRRRITGAHAFFLGALLALFALAPAILPYGGRFVTRGDFIEQQLPFILETRRILRGGPFFRLGGLFLVRGFFHRRRVGNQAHSGRFPLDFRGKIPGVHDEAVP